MKDAWVVGSGPNGMTAAILLARAGLRVTVLEAQSTPGGGVRSAELTLPGFLHDICSAVYPLTLSSPVFASFPLKAHGLEWIQPPAAAAHPFDNGTCAMVYRSIEETARRLGRDRFAWRWTHQGPVWHWNELSREILAPLLHLPAHPVLLARFGMFALGPAALEARMLFRTPEARALFAGMAAHAILPLEKPASAAFGWVMSISAHAVGWPVPRGGSQRITGALASYLESLGGKVLTNTKVRSLDEFGRASIVMCDITPRQFLELAGDRLPPAYRHRLERYRYGPGVYKLDWALDGPIPWKAAECAKSATVHVGGTIEEIAESERGMWQGAARERPFVLVVQPSLFDRSRAPEGKHTGWAYCHVPNGSSQDMTERIEAQIERFAPGFRKTILGRHAMGPAEMEAHNANLVGGDVESGGAQDLPQLFLRPAASMYRTPLENVYLCSSSTPPGGGVHGMCGYNAVQVALKDHLL